MRFIPPQASGAIFFFRGATHKVYSLSEAFGRGEVAKSDDVFHLLEKNKRKASPAVDCFEVVTRSKQRKGVSSDQRKEIGIYMLV